MTIPNMISILRMGLIPFFLMAMIYGHYEVAVWLFIGSGISDAVDGAIARFFNQRSQLGAFLDPMADKLMMTAVYVAVALPHIGLPHPIPLWVPMLTIGRDVVIVLIVLVLHLQGRLTKFPPSWPGKCTTFFQIVFAAAALVQNAYGLPEAFVLFLLWLVVFFTVFSGVHYLWRVRHQLAQAEEVRP